MRLSAVGPLTIGNILTTGDFWSSTIAVLKVLANGKSCTVYVAFKPKAAVCAPSVDHSGQRILQPVHHDCTKRYRKRDLRQRRILGIDNQLSKTVSAPLTITVTNKSAGGITFGAVGLTESTDFGITANTCPAAGHVLAGAASCTINVVFKPQSTGQKKGALTIADNDPQPPSGKRRMSGNGYSNASLSPATVNFPVQAVGTTTLTSSALKVTLTNNTGAALDAG